jgi:hypothetical protein
MQKSSEAQAVVSGSNTSNNFMIQNKGGTKISSIFAVFEISYVDKSSRKPAVLLGLTLKGSLYPCNSTTLSPYSENVGQRIRSRIKVKNYSSRPSYIVFEDSDGRFWHESAGTNKLTSLGSDIKPDVERHDDIGVVVSLREQHFACQ